eukprot:scaffold361_cov248-Pinguiococcus_pyrenoidosus.AAC.25
MSMRRSFVIVSTAVVSREATPASAQAFSTRTHFLAVVAPSWASSKKSAMASRPSSTQLNAPMAHANVSSEVLSSSSRTCKVSVAEMCGQ